MTTPAQARFIRLHNRHRLWFSLASLSLYASFLLQYGWLRDFFAAPLLAGSPATRGMALFAGVIAGFLLLEFLYMRRRDSEQLDHE